MNDEPNRIGFMKVEGTWHPFLLKKDFPEAVAAKRHFEVCRRDPNIEVLATTEYPDGWLLDVGPKPGTKDADLPKVVSPSA